MRRFYNLQAIRMWMAITRPKGPMGFLFVGQSGKVQGWEVGPRGGLKRVATLSLPAIPVRPGASTGMGLDVCHG